MQSGLRLATALLGVASGAAAQNARRSADDAEAVEEVVVTGFRASLDKALDAKQAQVGAIDMIVAEDIADFPDLNLAESLQRVPGVVIARDAGEGRQISVRGLGPQFTRVRINGIEAMSANGGTDAAGGTNRGRNFDFNTFASELFSNITVRKTAVGGNRRRLARRDRRSAHRPPVRLRRTHDRRLGADGLQRSERRCRSARRLPHQQYLRRRQVRRAVLGRLHQAQAWSTKARARCAGRTRRRHCRRSVRCDPAYVGTPTLAQINAAFRPRIPRYDQYEHEQERLGVTAALQFAPSESTTFSLDVLYAQFDADARRALPRVACVQHRRRRRASTT